MISKPEPLLHDDLEHLLDVDPELQAAYLRGLLAIGSDWSDEALAEAAFRLTYPGGVDDLMLAWRLQQALNNPAHPEHAACIAVHNAVQRLKDRGELS